MVKAQAIFNWFKAFNALLPNLITLKNQVVNYLDVTLVDIWTNFDYNNMLADGTHPNELGDREMAARWYTTMAPDLNLDPFDPSDPIPNPIVKSGLAVQIEDFVQVPPSSGSPPLARILLLKHSRDNTGRLFVNDILGKLYVINGGIITTYLDLASLHPNFFGTAPFANGFISFAFHPDFSTNGKFYTAHSEFPDAVPPWLTWLVALQNLLRPSTM